MASAAWLYVRVEPIPDTDCPDCGFEALLQPVAIVLSTSGVTERHMDPFCGRCRAEQRRANR